MEYIFITYSQIDEEITQRLTNRLESSGFKVWLDESVDETTDQLSRQTTFAIERSDAFLFVLSATALYSERLRQQLQTAGNSKKPIVPIAVEKVLIPDSWKQHLADHQTIELAEDFEDGVGQLLEWLKHVDAVVEAEVMETLDPDDTFGGEDVDQPSLLPGEQEIWSEEGYYWFKNWRSLTRIRALMTDQRLLFLWDSRDAWKWKPREWDELSENFPILIPLVEIADIGQVQKPKTLLIFSTSEPYVEIQAVSGTRHKITLLKNFQQRMEQLRGEMGRLRNGNGM